MTIAKEHWRAVDNIKHSPIWSFVVVEQEVTLPDEFEYKKSFKHDAFLRHLKANNFTQQW